MLRVSGLRCAYDTGVVLGGVDLTVAEGEIVGLLGRNGIGKTSLARSIVGFRPPVVTSGSITYNDQEMLELRTHKVAQSGIGFVPQGRRVFGSLSVSENLTVTSRGVEDSSGWTVDRVFDFFPGLAERKSQKAKSLSGGEQQMLAIARALMTNPTLLVMDEASEGLAPTVLVAIGERLAELKGSGVSVLLIEQNVSLAQSLGDRICLLGGGGTIVWEGSPEEFVQAEAAQREHLGV